MSDVRNDFPDVLGRGEEGGVYGVRSGVSGSFVDEACALVEEIEPVLPFPESVALRGVKEFCVDVGDDWGV